MISQANQKLGGLCHLLCQGCTKRFLARPAEAGSHSTSNVGGVGGVGCVCVCVGGGGGKFVQIGTFLAHVNYTLFNIGPKVGPPHGPPPFFACRPKNEMDPCTLFKNPGAQRRRNRGGALGARAPHFSPQSMKCPTSTGVHARPTMYQEGVPRGAIKNRKTWGIAPGQ